MKNWKNLDQVWLLLRKTRTETHQYKGRSLSTALLETESEVKLGKQCITISVGHVATVLEQIYNFISATTY